MSITHAIVRVRIGAPYYETLEQVFRVKEGSSYIKQGFKIGRILIIDFVEQKIQKPTPKDFQIMLDNSEIHVSRFR